MACLRGQSALGYVFEELFAQRREAPTVPGGRRTALLIWQPKLGLVKHPLRGLPGGKVHGLKLLELVVQASARPEGGSGEDTTLGGAPAELRAQRGADPPGDADVDWKAWRVAGTRANATGRCAPRDLVRMRSRAHGPAGDRRVQNGDGTLDHGRTPFATECRRPGRGRPGAGLGAWRDPSGPAERIGTQPQGSSPSNSISLAGSPRSLGVWFPAVQRLPQPEDSLMIRRRRADR
jgi:hypothetical protein